MYRFGRSVEGLGTHAPRIQAHLGVILAHLGSSWPILAHLGATSAHHAVTLAFRELLEESFSSLQKLSKSSSRAGESLIFMFCEIARKKYVKRNMPTNIA